MSRPMHAASLFSPIRLRRRRARRIQLFFVALALLAIVQWFTAPPVVSVIAALPVAAWLAGAVLASIVDAFIAWDQRRRLRRFIDRAARRYGTSPGFRHVHAIDRSAVA